MTHHLIVAAHGSRRAEANREIRALVENLRESLRPPFVDVAPAFLEFADPSVPAALDAAVAHGATDVTVFPLFLTAGRHLEEDVPALLEEAGRRHQGARFALLTHLGSAPGFDGFVRCAIENAM